MSSVGSYGGSSRPPPKLGQMLQTCFSARWEWGRASADMGAQRAYLVHAFCRSSSVLPPSAGKAYSLGRAEYGRLGLGEGAEEKSIPTLISRLPAVSSVACGASVGYAVTKDGELGLPTRGVVGFGGNDSYQTAPQALMSITK